MELWAPILITGDGAPLVVLSPRASSKIPGGWAVVARTTKWATSFWRLGTALATGEASLVLGKLGHLLGGPCQQVLV